MTRTPCGALVGSGNHSVAVRLVRPVVRSMCEDAHGVVAPYIAYDLKALRLCYSRLRRLSATDLPLLSLLAVIYAGRRRWVEVLPRQAATPPMQQSAGEDRAMAFPTTSPKRRRRPHRRQSAAADPLNARVIQMVGQGAVAVAQQKQQHRRSSSSAERRAYAAPGGNVDPPPFRSGSGFDGRTQVALFGARVEGGGRRRRASGIPLGDGRGPDVMRTCFAGLRGGFERAINALVTRMSSR